MLWWSYRNEKVGLNPGTVCVKTSLSIPSENHLTVSFFSPKVGVQIRFNRQCHYVACAFARLARSYVRPARLSAAPIPPQ